MPLPPGICPLCGSVAAKVRLKAELQLVATDDSILGAQRNFVGDCPRHGEVFVKALIGNHSTLGAKKMKQRYSDDRRRRIWSRLPDEERKRFIRAVYGHHFPSGDEMARWDRLSILPSPSPIAEWLGSMEHFRAS